MQNKSAAFLFLILLSGCSSTPLRGGPVVLSTPVEVHTPPQYIYVPIDSALTSPVDNPTLLFDRITVGDWIRAAKILESSLEEANSKLREIQLLQGTQSD